MDFIRILWRFHKDSVEIGHFEAFCRLKATLDPCPRPLSVHFASVNSAGHHMAKSPQNIVGASRIAVAVKAVKMLGQSMVFVDFIDELFRIFTLNSHV
jgi:hypothetical protein